MTAEREHSGHSVDAFHRGRFHLVQPKGRGHRAGLDAMLLAAAIARTFSGTVADLGAGSGAAALAVLSRSPDARALLIEAEPEMAECARRTLGLDQNAAQAKRASVIEADVTLTGKFREAAGLTANMADAVILNPPFNDNSDRATTDPLRRSAHVLEDGGLELWLRTAAAIARPDCWCAMICRPRHLQEALAAMGRRFGGLELRFIHPRPAEPAIRLVLRGRRQSRAHTSVTEPLVLHDENGNNFRREAEMLINGEADLF